MQLPGLEPGKLEGKRLEAWKHLQDLSFPTMGDEVWRRTDPEFLRPENLQVAAPASEFRSLVEGQGIPSGIHWGPLEKHAEAFQNSLFSVQPLGKANFFSALNGVIHQGGTYLKAGRDVSTGENALLAHHHFGGQGVAAPRSYLEVASGSSVTLVEFFSAEGDGILAVPTVEVRVEAGARLRYVFVNLWNDSARVVPTVHAQVDRDGHFEMLFAGLGSKMTKAFFESDLVGEGSKSEVFGLVLAQGRQHYDVDAQQNHRLGNTVSDVLFHIALTDRARSVFAGNILCEPGAQGIDGYQQNRNLLLSDKARADSMPRLEIEANDVRCTHGASFSTYDADQRFYLQSRGLTAFEAEHLLVSGFFSAVTERLDHEKVSEWLAEKVEAKMIRALGREA